MFNPLAFFRRTVLSGSADTAEHRWEDIENAMWQFISVPLTAEAETALVAVLHFDGRIRISPSSEIPHSMSPEEMLKSLAVQALGKWTGLTYLLEMQRVQTMASSPVLSGIARKVIQEVMQTKKRTSVLEAVAESSAEGLSKTRIRPVLQDRGMTFRPDRSVRRRELQFA